MKLNLSATRPFVLLGLCAAAVAGDQSAPSKVTAGKIAAEAVNIPVGFRKKLVKGQVMYCTTTTTIGSRFPKQFCVDEDGLRALAESRASQQQDLTKSQSLCASAAACQVQ